MDKRERFNAAFDYLKSHGLFHTQKELAEKMGAAAPNVSSALKGDPKILTDRFLHRFNNAFGDIFSLEWLCLGEGVMVAGDTDAIIKERNQTVIGDNNTTTQNNSSSNNNNTTTNNYRGCGGEDAKAAKEIADMGDRVTALEDGNDIYTIPLLPISAQGGSFNDFVVSVKDSECEKIISPIKGADFAMSVSGDSMAPEYPSGSQILIKRINENAFIDWGRVYVLDTCNGTVIKRLFPSEKEDAVVCKSINPEYPPFEVSFEDVYGVYRVLMCMSVK